jgi:hypothetical protein
VGRPISNWAHVCGTAELTWKLGLRRVRWEVKAQLAMRRWAMEWFATKKVRACPKVSAIGKPRLDRSNVRDIISKNQHY